MMGLRGKALELSAWLRAPGRLRASGPRPGAGDAALAAVVAWLRTIVLPDDVLYLEVPRGAHARGFARFPFPSLPSSVPEPCDPADGARRLRFVVRAPGPAVRPDAGRPVPDDGEVAPGVTGRGFRAVLSLRDVVVLERDTPHDRERPLRLGVSLGEMAWLLSRARASADRCLAGGGAAARPALTNAPSARFKNQRATVAVAIWTRGQLRGSIITPPGPLVRSIDQGAAWACRDTRFAPLGAKDLESSVIQVGLVHPPGVPLSRSEIETEDAYPDKALFLSQGMRSGAYMPEILNIAPRRKLAALVKSLAEDKVGLDPEPAEGVGRPRTDLVVHAHEVSEAIERPAGAGAALLDGPVTRLEAGDAGARARAAGNAACDWLAAVQNEDGSLPNLVRPRTGKGEGAHVARMAMTAEALAAYGLAAARPGAVTTARRVLGWLDRTRSEWKSKPELALLTAAYAGKAALRLRDEPAAAALVKDVLAALPGVPRSPLPLAHALSFLDAASPGNPEAGLPCEALRRDLHDRFASAARGDAPMNLAEWAELAAALPRGSAEAREVGAWLAGRQLPSGAFPETTASSFVYTRGTGKVFEALAFLGAEHRSAVDRALAWLLSMQYREDSAFFIPEEHRARLFGGLRHDYFNTEAWIDSAGHMLLGLARLFAP